MSGNYLTQRGLGRGLALLLTVVMLASCLGFAGIAAEQVYAGEGSGSSSEAEQALEKVIDYYEVSQDAKLTDFWELLAIYAAGEDLTHYVLPKTKTIDSKSTPSDYADVFITELIKGRLPAKEWAQSLANKQSGTGSFGYEMSNQQAWSIIALDLYNRNAQEADRVSYNIGKAIDYLMTFQTNGNFYFSGQYPDPGVDYTGPASIALAPYTDEELWPDTLEFTSLITALKYDKGKYGSYGNPGAAAFAIFGYNALEVEKTEEDYQAAVTELIEYQVADGGFYSPWADTSKSDAYYTKQAAVALSEIIAGESLFLSLTKNTTEYISVNVTVQEADGIVAKALTTTTETTVREIVESLVTEGSGPTDYKYYIDGTEIDGEATMEEGQKLVAVPETIRYLATFSTDKEEAIIGETVNLSLSITSLGTGEVVLTAPGAELILNGVRIHNFEENESLDYAFSPVEAGSYTFSVNWPENITDYSDVSFTLIVKELDQAVPVSIRVEGITGNILYNNAFIVRGSQSLLTVLDAITQALDHEKKPYTTNGVQILSINNVENDTTYVTSRYWMYTMNKERYLNNSDWVLPTTLIQDNDEIIVFCGSNASYPFVGTELQRNGDVKLVFTSYQYNDDWEKVLQPIGGASVNWAAGTENAYLAETDNNGVVTIPAAYAEEGSYNLQIQKMGEDGAPLVIRLASDYQIHVTPDGAGGSVPSAPGDSVPKVSIQVIGPNNKTFFSKTNYTYYDGMTALDLLRRTGLNIEYSDSSKKYVSSIEGVAEFDDGPASGWLFKVNNDESILSSAASYELEAGDSVVWFYTPDYTKEKGSSKWSGEVSQEITGTITKTSLSFALKEMKAGNEDSWTVNLAQGSITFDKDALKGLIDQMKGDTVEITIEPAAQKDLSAKQREAAGDRPVYDIRVVSGGKEISGFGGKLTIALPYTLKDGESPSGVLVYRVDSSGNLTPLGGSYDPVSGKVTFTSDQLSHYMVGYDKTLVKWPFADVEESDGANWYYNAVKYVYEQGIFSGTSATTFEPDSPLTRSMLVSVLARMSEADLTAYKTAGFSDVDMNSWYGPSVAWAKEMGIVSGYAGKDGSFTFRPDDRISRQDIAVMINNYNEKVAKKAYSKSADSVIFTDHGQIGDYAKAAVSAMQQAGIINGVKNADGSFRFQPLNNATRAEAATMIYNMLIKE